MDPQALNDDVSPGKDDIGMMGQYAMERPPHEMLEAAQEKPPHERMLSAPVRRARQQTMSVGWGATEFDEDEDPVIEPMRFTSFMVDHPFLVHFIALVVAIGVSFLNPNEYILSDVTSFSAILPDYGMPKSLSFL